MPIKAIVKSNVPFSMRRGKQQDESSICCFVWWVFEFENRSIVFFKQRGKKKINLLEINVYTVEKTCQRIYGYLINKINYIDLYII